MGHSAGLFNAPNSKFRTVPATTKPEPTYIGDPKDGDFVDNATMKFMSPVYKMYGIANDDDKKILDEFKSRRVAQRNDMAVQDANVKAYLLRRQGPPPADKTLLGE